MKKTAFLFVFIFLFSLVGCNSSKTSTYLPTVTQTLTQISTATQTPVTATVTPFPPLQTNGPYFSYFKKVDVDYQLVMLDADGKGRKEISFTQEIKDAIANQEFYPSMQFVSPTGEWMAYFTGTAGRFPLNPEDNLGPFDLTLNLLDLETGETQIISQLLSEDYPNNFLEAEKQINDSNINAITLQGTFVVGITKAISWSPDGKYLAFAGQMDGLSSDLYVYEVETQAIRRLSSGSQELQWISWLPDGRRILYSSTYIYGVETIYDVYAVDLEGVSTVKLSSFTNLRTDCLNSSPLYFENDSENIRGRYNLRQVNIDTGKISRIWMGAYGSCIIDSKSEWMALIAYTPDIDPLLYVDFIFGVTVFSDTTPGLYLINLSTLEKRKIELSSDEAHLSYKVYPFKLNNQKFVLLSEDLQSYFLSEDLQLTPTDIKDISITISPDNNYYAGITDKGINIYSSDNTMLKFFEIPVEFPYISELVWNQNSDTLFLIDKVNIYSIKIISGEVEKVETNLDYHYIHEGLISYKWIEIP